MCWGALVGGITTSQLATGAAVAGLGLSAYGMVNQIKAQRQAGRLSEEAYRLEMAAVEAERRARVKESEAQAEQLESSADAISFNIGVTEHDERLAKWQAADVLRRGHEDASRRYRQVRQVQGEQVATIAANGVQVGKGTMAQVIDDTARVGREDVEMIVNNAQRDAYEYQLKAWENRNQRSLLMMERDQYLRSASHVRSTKRVINTTAIHKTRSAQLGGRIARQNANAAMFNGFASFGQAVGNFGSLWRTARA